MTSDRHDPDATAEPGDEFWGHQAEWNPRDLPSTGRHGLGATIARWWDGLLGGTEGGVRAHGRTRETERGVHTPAPAGERTDGPNDAPHQYHHLVDLDVDADQAWELQPEPEPVRRGGVDPLIARLGGLAVILTLVAPLMVGFTASGSDADGDLLTTISNPSTTGTAEAAASDRATTLQTSAPAAIVPTAPAPPSSVVPETSSTPANAAPPSSMPVVAEAASLEVASAAQPATTTAVTTPVTTVPSCGNRYELAAGDYWIRIADAADVALADLLEVNDASVDTVLVPGRSICLPAGASTPAPPATAAPVTAAPAPATTAAPSRPATTAPPAPTTTVLSRPAAVPTSEAVAIIREVWPDDLEERALDIAWRESNHRSNVNNYCCYGLFQIHWEAHRSWLATLGVTSVSQLFDPVVNTNAAYTLYQRSGGFGPWGG